MKVYIYDLSDPRTGHVRYVGKSVDPKERLAVHIREARRGSVLHSRRWIDGLLKNGMLPTLGILEESTSDAANECERFWISMLGALGCDLTNRTPGGDGQSPGYRPTADSLRKQSEAQRAKGGWSEEHRAAHAAALAKPETREKMSRTRAGRVLSEETRGKIAKSLSGRARSQETRDKIAASARGRKQSAETIAKRVAKLVGRVGRSGWTHSDEARKKIGDASKARKSAATALAARWGRK